MILKSISKVASLAGMVVWMLSGMVCAQPSNVVDQVSAVVGSKILLKSEIEAQYQQVVQQGAEASEALRCRIIDQLLTNKVLLNQAILDSIEISDAQVDNELDRRLAYMVRQIGSERKLEQYYDKSIPEIRDEFKPLIKDQLLIQSMQSKVTRDISVSPAEVRAFFNEIPPDSLPLINAELEYAQIVLSVPVSDEEKRNIREKLNEYRKRVNNGEDFATLAILYSQDGSSRNGGELGFVTRGDLVPEFEAAAFKLRKNEVSEVVETKFGFHIIQMIERRGEQINVRHILIKPTYKPEDVNKAFARADSIYKDIQRGMITFSDAAQRYSEDNDSRYNGGTVVNQANGTTRFEADEVDPGVFFQLDKMAVGEISAPIQSLSAEGNTAFRILYLKARAAPHKASLDTDYQRIQQAAQTEKENKVLTDWVKKKKKVTFVQISEDLKTCKNLEHWFDPQ